MNPKVVVEVDQDNPGYYRCVGYWEDGSFHDWKAGNQFAIGNTIMVYLAGDHDKWKGKVVDETCAPRPMPYTNEELLELFELAVEAKQDTSKPPPYPRYVLRAEILDKMRRGDKDES